MGRQTLGRQNARIPAPHGDVMTNDMEFMTILYYTSYSSESAIFRISDLGGYAPRTNKLPSATLSSGKIRGSYLTLATREATVSLEELTEVGPYPFDRPAELREFSILHMISCCEYPLVITCLLVIIQPFFTI
jgi:hypothetical protein